jgi:haloacetate dehalogenase
MFEGFERFSVDADGVAISGRIRRNGNAPALLLLHGYPQTHCIWHKMAPRLAERYTVVATDLRGYGDSAKPPGGADHAAYSKRAMAADQVRVMRALGFERFDVIGHDRGARVAHRMALDHEARVGRLAVLDIVPTYKIFAETNRRIATDYYHWFFLIQPYDFPERLIGNDAPYYLRAKMGRWSAGTDVFTPAAMAEYLRCFDDPAAIHASCEDYRAAATIDLDHDRADLARRIEAPLLALWGAKGAMARNYDVLATWRERARNVAGRAIDCGHFLPEEAPDATLAALFDFLDHRPLV